MNVLFFGTPALCVPYLEWIHKHQKLVGVVCRADKPVGRGQEVTAPPPKQFALANNIPVFQPTGPWTQETVDTLKNLNADIGIAIAYGRLIPDDVINAARLGCINLHFSLLPAYRGAAPVQWALINGDKKTGVTAFWLVHQLDAGPIFVEKSVDIADDDDALSLHAKLAVAGIDVLAELFKNLEQGQITRREQQGTPTLAPILKKEDGQIDWSKPASAIVNLVRGVREWPGAVTSFWFDAAKRSLKIHAARVGAEKTIGVAGKIVAADAGGIVVNSGEGTVVLVDVQPEGKKSMPAWAFWQGARLKVGDHLG